MLEAKPLSALGSCATPWAFLRGNKGLTPALPSSLQGSPSPCAALLLLGLSCPCSGCLAPAHLSLANPGQTSGMQIMFPVHPNHVSKNLSLLFLVALEDSYFKEQPCCLAFQFISLPLCLPSQPALPKTESRLLAVLAGSIFTLSAGRDANFPLIANPAFIFCE